jgi:hypothetical protein
MVGEQEHSGELIADTELWLRDISQRISRYSSLLSHFSTGKLRIQRNSVQSNLTGHDRHDLERINTLVGNVLQVVRYSGRDSGF